MKNLTVNRLALGNIKQRKKQYIMLILGVILAMVFSSTIPLLLASASETYNQSEFNRLGKQNVILYYPDFSEKDYQQFVDKNILSEYGFAHHIGYAYPKGSECDGVLGAEVTWLDDKAKELSYQTFLEGSYPSKENEIAAEETALMRLGYKDAKVGDKIKFSLRIQNNNDYLGFVEKEYTLSGIARDKKKSLETKYGSDLEFYDNLVPGFFVMQNTQIEAGGREKLVAYCNYTENALKSDETFGYLSSLDENWDVNDNSNNDSFTLHALSQFGDGDLILAVIAVLIFASCVAIVNAFNTNLKERKRQIGMLRAVGTTKRQIINIFGREALLITLITAPISIVISYFIVKIILGFIYDEPYMTKSVLVLPISIALNIIVVMLAALIPLKSASKITPMQAIRNIENTRQVKRKKIISKKEYSPSKLIAKRSLTFSKGSRVAVCILLCATIIVSCLGFSFVAYMKENIRELGADYTLEGMSFHEDYINTDTSMRGFTESDRTNIASMPEVESISGEKNLSACIEIDKYNDYFNLLMADNYAWNRNHEKLSKEELIKQWLATASIDSGDPVDKNDYLAIKQVLQAKKELFKAPIQTQTEEQIKKLQGKLLDGKIDLNKISSGEEVILVAPKEVRYYLSKRNGGVYVERKYDGKTNKTMEEIASATGNFKAGDMIDVIVGVVSSDYDDTAQQNKYTLLDKKTKKVKIGAIISPNDAKSFSYEFGIITTLEGIETFYKNASYDDININVIGDVDEETNQHMMETLQLYVDRYGGFAESNYEYVSWQVEQYHSFMAALVVIIILGFVICASIINNSISARIRENKSVIGTLRAVGADTSTLVKVYINEMLSMFSLGTIIGYSIFAVIWIALLIAEKNFEAHIEFVFQPWQSIAMTAVLFAACAINLWLKVKKEMKNSIVENIREL